MIQADLTGRYEVGGLPQAVLRALIYVRLPERSVDERAFAMLQAIRAMQPADNRITFTDLKAAVKEQFLLLHLDEKRAVSAIPRLLPDSEAMRAAGVETVRRILQARGTLSEESARRLARIEALFGVDQRRAADRPETEHGRLSECPGTPKEDRHR